MYTEHMPLLRDYGSSNHAAFADIVTFVLLSIRQPFVTIATQMDDVRKNGADSKYLWGWKYDGYQCAHSAEGNACYQYCVQGNSTHDCIFNLVRAIPGLGIVKAGFVLQILGRNIGCLDSRNMQRLNIGKRTYRYDTDYSDKRLHNLIDDYQDACLNAGGAERLWDDWCENLALDTEETAEYVSALHLTAIRPEERKVP